MYQLIDKHSNYIITNVARLLETKQLLVTLIADRRAADSERINSTTVQIIWFNFSDVALIGLMWAMTAMI